MDAEKLIRELNNHYGPAEGGNVFRTVMPGILKDFHELVMKAGTGTVVREEYRMDDGTGRIVMTGMKNRDGKLSLEASFYA